MRYHSLSEWLAWQETLHFKEIDPGLERISKVWHLLNGDAPLPFKIVTVAGTNGKGSSVALLTSILRAAGYHTGSYTSPHLLRYNERMAIDGVPASDDEICRVFHQLDTVRGEVSLTYFEYATLAAIQLFIQHQVDIVILEVGMGGRLDAVNIFDADIALITPIGLDHTNWLGDTIELIGAEKAGILRANQHLVCSQSHPPQSVLNRAQQLGTDVSCAENAFSYTVDGDSWYWQSAAYSYSNLPKPALLGAYQFQNAAAVIQVITLLATQHGLTHLDESAIKVGLQQVKLSGRFQILPGDVERIFDVTHNVQGAENLATLLKQFPCSGKTYAVVAMLRDKDSHAVFNALKESIDAWYLGGLSGERGQTAEQLAVPLMSAVPSQNVHLESLVEMAYQRAMSDAHVGDRVLVFGSFHTVEAVMRAIPEFISS